MTIQYRFTFNEQNKGVLVRALELYVEMNPGTSEMAKRLAGRLKQALPVGNTK